MPRSHLDPIVLARALIDVYGVVVTSAQIHAFATTHCVSPRTLSRCLNVLEAEHLLLRPRRNLYLIDLELTDDDRRIAAARAACIACGYWAVIAGAWALHLRGLVPATTPSIDRGMRFVWATRSVHPPSRTVFGHRSTFVAASEGEVPPQAAGRHVLVVGTMPVAPVTVSVERLGRVSVVESTEGGHVHALDPEWAVVSMFSSVRLAGGFDAARATCAQALPHLCMDTLRVATRGARCATRRRVACALREIGRVVDDPRLPRDRAELERFAHINAGTGGTLLEPHRIAAGPRDVYTGLRDNRGAPLRPAQVLIPRDVPVLEPEVFRSEPSSELQEYEAAAAAARAGQPPLHPAKFGPQRRKIEQAPDGVGRL